MQGLVGELNMLRAREAEYESVLKSKESLVKHKHRERPIAHPMLLL